MSKARRRIQNELFHSDIYLGEEFSEGLYHFKYIDKVFKNGKWKYIYDAAAKVRDNARTFYNNRILGKNDNYYRSLRGNVIETANSAKKAFNAANKKFNEQAKKAKNTYKKTKRKANATLKKYRAAGKNFINNLIKRK